jgi:hypothetical protein
MDGSCNPSNGRPLSIKAKLLLFNLGGNWGINMINDVVARELRVSHGWTREFVDKLAPYYLATLTNMSLGRATPVYQVIDAVWHAHILCTQDYANFCARTFGRFIHHERTETANNNHGSADDFLQSYGLSVAGLTSICAELGVNQDLLVANCSQEDEEPLVGPETKTQANQVRLATCTDPAPPEILPVMHAEPQSGRLSIAKCGSPTPPRGSPKGDLLLDIASCGQPDQPEAAPPTIRCALGAG